MDIKSAKYFREKYMTDVRYVKPNYGCNPAYMGHMHKTQDGTIIKGFFEVYHGDKDDIGGFCSGSLSWILYHMLCDFRIYEFCLQ